MAVKPVVDGLSKQYADRVNFQVLDASEGAGKQAYESLMRPGHPSYVMLTPAGKQVYRSSGFKTEADIVKIINEHSQP
jgi:hypothetical protein